MTTTIIILLLSFAALIYSAILLVEGASSLASRFGVSNLIIGLTVVAFGTSLPELTINTFNSIKGLNDAVLGNVIGSNIFNILLILGVSGFIFPIKVEKSSVAYEVPFSIVVSLILLFIVNDLFWSENSNKLSRRDASLLLGLFVLFLVYVFRAITNSPEDVKVQIRPIHKSILFILAGLGLMIFGGYQVTKSATTIAIYFGMSEKLIALTVLSIGTSLPELVTSVVAAYKKQPDMAVGNVIGSNIFNFTFVLGISGMIHPVQYNLMLNSDMYVLLLGSALLMIAMFTGVKLKLDRWEAALLLILYISYTIYIIHRN